MPDALIVSEKECLQRNGRINYGKLVRLLVKRGIISNVTVDGRPVYGRAYLPKPSIRKAYKKERGIK